MSAPIRVTQDRGDWLAVCDARCDDPLNLLCASTWGDAYEVAIGHACMKHPRPCHHEWGYHPYGTDQGCRDSASEAAVLLRLASSFLRSSSAASWSSSTWRLSGLDHIDLGGTL